MLMCHTSSLLPMEENFLSLNGYTFMETFVKSHNYNKLLLTIKYITQKEILIIYCLSPHGKGDRVE